MKNFISPTYKHKNLGILAIGTILVLIISTQVITQAILYQQAENDRLMAEVSQLPALGQKISQAAALVQAGLYTKPDHESSWAEIDSVHKAWNAAHDALLTVRPASSALTDPSDSLAALLQRMQPYRDSISNAVITLINTHSSKDRRAQAEIRKIERNNDRELVSL